MTSQNYRESARPGPSNRSGSQPGGVLRQARPPSSKSGITPELVITLGFAGFALIILGILSVFSIYILFTFSDVIMPGVVAGETKLGGLNSDQALEKLNLEWNYEKQLIVSDGKTEWQDSPAGFGLYLDSAATAQNAYMVGRGHDGISQFISIILKHQWRVMPEVVFNQEIAEATLQLYGQVTNIPPYDATLTFQDGEWEALPGVYGTAIDVEQVLADLYVNRKLIMTSEYFSLTMIPVAPQFEDVSVSLDQLEPQLNTPINILAYDPIIDGRWSLMYLLPGSV